MYDCEGKMAYSMTNGQTSGEMKAFSCVGWSRTGCDKTTVTNRERKVFSREHDFAADEVGGQWALNTINGKKYSCKANLKYTLEPPSASPEVELECEGPFSRSDECRIDKIKGY